MSIDLHAVRKADVVVIGGGLIGLAIALELADGGAKVTVVERGKSLAGASTAAAGMLAADDPYNPPELHALSRLSIEAYPQFLKRIEALSGIGIRYQTETTHQYMEDGSTRRLAEHSLDPRELARAMDLAVKATSICLLEQTQIVAAPGGRSNTPDSGIKLSDGTTISSGAIVYATGAWTSQVVGSVGGDAISVSPRKGQMLRVRLPFTMTDVHRSERVYVVPRTHGLQAGTALIGATVEDAGFDTSVRSKDLDELRALAAKMIPALGSAEGAPMVESWAGLRPASPDKLPVLGACMRRGQFIATGHYRNGILQAPGTALVIKDLLQGRAPRIDVSALSPQRFTLPVLV